MSDKLNEIAKGSFLRVNEEGKAYWGQSEGGGGAGIFIVNLDTAAKTYDKSLSEIFDAHKKGCIVITKNVKESVADNGTIMYGEIIGYLTGILENFMLGPDSKPFNTAVIYVPGIASNMDTIYYYLFEDGTFSDRLAE